MSKSVQSLSSVLKYRPALACYTADRAVGLGYSLGWRVQYCHVCHNAVGRLDRVGSRDPLRRHHCVAIRK